MRIQSLDHIQLAMPAGGEAQTRAFYCTLLGIPETPKPAHLAARGGCWFERGALKVHLGVDADFRPARKAHVAFIVEDLRALASACNQSGYSTRSDEPLPGYDRVYVDDPFGNRLELMEAVDRAG
jgi:catechol 2,3-dioxygenase-like lactoylglutathione lyase family enzyme